MRRKIRNILLTLGMLIGVSVAIAPNANAWTTSPSDSYPYCAALVRPHVIGVKPSERCYPSNDHAEFADYVHGYNILGVDYQDVNYKGQQLYYISEPTCDGISTTYMDFYVDVVPDGWNDKPDSYTGRDKTCNFVDHHQDGSQYGDKDVFVNNNRGCGCNPDFGSMRNQTSSVEFREDSV